MTEQYIVHDAVSLTAEKDAQLADGSPVRAIVPAFKVQLVQEDGPTIPLSFYGAKIEEAQKTFIPGATISVTFHAASK